MTKDKASCPCRACEVDRTGYRYSSALMHLCEICGNKRCPHATEHRLECANSNEPGQPGSVYA